ncbi:MAG TPA: DedA family protein [Anaeromyxobacter sp.]|nr:DedA family protein [Anaeromyxobacter sp.]
MTTLQGMVDALGGAVSRTGDVAPLVLFFATLVEYVFPPFPGDLLVVLGAWYAVEGALSWPATFASVTAGALVGAWIDYRIGVVVGRRLEGRLAARSGLSAERLARFEASYRRWGDLLLVVNRFFPGIRAFFFIAAGASRIPLAKVLLYGGISAALWNALLLAGGALFAKNAAEFVALFERYTRVAWTVVIVGAVVAVAVVLWRRRRAPGAEGGP